MKMSLDKAIKSGKEHRKPYRGSKRIDVTCRNHGSCPWCKENRQHKFRDKDGESMLDDFIMNDSYDAWAKEFDEQMQAWEAYCAEVADETYGNLKN